LVVELGIVGVTQEPPHVELSERMIGRELCAAEEFKNLMIAFVVHKAVGDKS
jgi:hypothetical protein